MLNVTRIYNDRSGDSHFEDIFIALQYAGAIGLLSKVFPASGIIFREVEPWYNWDYHTAPQKQFIILLDGEIEIETSTGEKRIFKEGDILLVEDTAGKGHKSRNVIQNRRKSIFVILPPDEV